MKGSGPDDFLFMSHGMSKNKVSLAGIDGD